MRLLLSIALLTSTSSGFSNPSLLHGNPAFISITTKNAFKDMVALKNRRESKLDMAQVSPRVANETTTGIPDDKADAFPGATLVNGKIDSVPSIELTSDNEYNIMRPPPDPSATSWEGIKKQLMANFRIEPDELDRYDAEIEEKGTLLELYKSMQLSRLFEVACNKQYMVR